MSSKGDGKKPLGNEGQPPQQPPPNPYAPIPWEFSQVRKGYDLIEAVIREQRHPLLTAILSNMRRHGLKDRIPDVATAAVAGGTAVAIGYPVLGAVIGIFTVLYRSVRETLRIRRNADEADNRAVSEVRKFMLYAAANASVDSAGIQVATAPHVQEFQILWIRHSWRLVHCIKGYNARVQTCLETYQDLERTPEQEGAATGILGLMAMYRPRLMEAFSLLEELFVKEQAPIDASDIVSMRRFNERLEELDPFQDQAKDLPGFEWLPLPSDTLIRAELPAQFQKDVVAFEASKDIHVQDIDKRFRELDERENTEKRVREIAEELEAGLDIKVDPEDR